MSQTPTSHNDIILLLREFSTSYFGSRDFFLCIYGSYATNDHTDKSDVDMFFGIKNLLKHDRAELECFVTNLHHMRGIPLDNEVPYSSKLAVSYRDLYVASRAQHFMKKGVFVVPQIRKTRHFLASRHVRLRLVFNALTSPHILVTGDYQQYLMFKSSAERSLVNLAMQLSKHSTPEVSHYLEAIFLGCYGEEGEYYLGYKKEREKVTHYLTDLFQRNNREYPDA